MNKHQVFFHSLSRLAVLCLFGCLMVAAVSSCGHRTIAIVTDSGRTEFFEPGYLKSAARAGNAEAQMLLGYYYYKQEGDEKRGVEWWRKAAAQGSENAKEHLRNVEKYLRRERERSRSGGWHLTPEDLEDLKRGEF